MWRRHACCARITSYSCCIYRCLERIETTRGSMAACRAVLRAARVGACASAARRPAAAVPCLARAACTVQQPVVPARSLFTEPAQAQAVLGIRREQRDVGRNASVTARSMCKSCALYVLLCSTDLFRWGPHPCSAAARGAGVAPRAATTALLHNVPPPAHFTCVHACPCVSSDAGLVPGRIYGVDSEGRSHNVNLWVRQEDLRTMVNTKKDMFLNTLFDLHVDGMAYRVLPRDLKRHPCTCFEHAAAVRASLSGVSHTQGYTPRLAARCTPQTRSTRCHVTGCCMSLAETLACPCPFLHAPRTRSAAPRTSRAAGLWT